MATKHEPAHYRRQACLAVVDAKVARDFASGATTPENKTSSIWTTPMRMTVIIAALILLTASAEAYTSRDRIERRFDRDIRAGTESMRARSGDHGNRIDLENTRLRERLNGTDSERLRPR